MSRFPVRFVAAVLVLAVVAAVPILYRQAERRAQLAPFQGEWLHANGQHVTVTGGRWVVDPLPPYFDGGVWAIGPVDLARSRVELGPAGHTIECNFRRDGDRLVLTYGVTYPDAAPGSTTCSMTLRRP
jgi:hypothetical protein